MARIIWTGPALADLEETAGYVALSNLPAAKKLVQTIFSKLARLEKHPQSGRIPPEIKDLSYREVVVTPCRIFYRVEGEQIFVLHVMRQEHDLRRFLLAKEPESSQ